MRAAILHGPCLAAAAAAVQGTCIHKQRNEGSPSSLSQSWRHIQPQKIDQSLYLTLVKCLTLLRTR